MNKKIFENARFCPKGDTEANWNKAVGFVPLDKEIIIYKKDETHSVARFKVGDGKTAVQDLPFSGTDIEAIQQLIDEKGELLIEYVDNTVTTIPQADWNQLDETAKDYIKNKPFGEKHFEITWDGIIGDRDTITPENSPDFIAVKVSDVILTYEDLLGALVENSDGGTDIISEEVLLPKGESEQAGVYGHSEFIILSIFDLDKCEAAIGVRPPSTGTYFMKNLFDNVYISSISKTEIIKLEGKYLPDRLATETYVDEKVAAIKVSTNYITTDTDQDRLRGNKSWILDTKTWQDAGSEYGISSKFSLKDGAIECTKIYHSKYLVSEDAYIAPIAYKLDENSLTLLSYAEPGPWGTRIGYTHYCGDKILYEIPGEIDEMTGYPYGEEITLTFPKESGIFATQEWIQNSFNLYANSNGSTLIDGNLAVNGNLTVKGETTTLDTITLQVQDNIIVTNSDGNTLIENAGFAIKTNTEDAYGIMYDPVGDGVKIGLGSLNEDGKFNYTEGEDQFLATRADTIANGHTVVWDDENKTLVDSGVDHSEYVKFTDYATGTKAGVAKFLNRGLAISNEGNVYITGASKAQIESKNAPYYPITTPLLDYAVKVGITTNTETWTDEEKAAACETIGAVKKPASFTGSAKVLSINASGVTGTLKYSSSPASDSIPVANSKGNIKTNTPQVDLDCANKKYVDDGFVAKPTDTSGFNRVYGINTNNDPLIYNVQLSSYSFTEEGKGSRNGLAQYVNGNLGCSIPTSDYHATPKIYVDGLIAELLARIEALETKLSTMTEEVTSTDLNSIFEEDESTGTEA